MENILKETLINKKQNINNNNSIKNNIIKSNNQTNNIVNKEKLEKIISNSRKPIEESPLEKTLKSSLIKSYTSSEILKRSFIFSCANYKNIIILYIISLISSFSSLLDPYYNSNIINIITTNPTYKKIKDSILKYILFQIFKKILFYFINRIKTHYNKINYQYYRNIVLENIAEKDIEFFDIFKTGEIIKMIDENKNVINNNNPIKKIINVSDSIIKLFGISYYLIKNNLKLTIIFFIMFLIKLPIDKIQSNKFKNKFKRIEPKYFNYINEFITNIKMIKSFGNEMLEIKKIEEIDPMKNILFDEEKISFQNFIESSGDLFKQICDSIFLFFAGIEILNKKMAYGDLILLNSYTSQIKNQYNSLVRNYNDISIYIEKWKNFFEIYDIKPKIISKKNIIDENIKGEIIFEDVVFTYPNKKFLNNNKNKNNNDNNNNDNNNNDNNNNNNNNNDNNNNYEPILKGINMHIFPGQKIAIVGTSGEGKSTIANLLQRMYDPDKGSIIIDKYNLKDLNLNFYRKKILAIVAQEPILNSGTIEDNITYGVDTYTQKDFEYACELSNVNKFVNNINNNDNNNNDNNNLNNGYKTLVGERGMQVSAGQKQRIAIARALIKHPKIIIFDEATSALDSKNEKEVQNAIDNIIKKELVTIIIIAHRLSTVKNADNIFVLKNGKIIEEGNHQKLINKKGEYFKLIENQLETFDFK